MNAPAQFSLNKVSLFEIAFLTKVYQTDYLSGEKIGVWNIDAARNWKMTNNANF